MTEQKNINETAQAFALTNPDHYSSLSVLILDEEQPLTIGEPLTTQEQQMLSHCEKIITQNLNGFFELGEALSMIKRAKLYRQEFSTFEEYCRERWNFGRQRAFQYIQAAEIGGKMLTSGLQISDLSERTLRPLASLEPAARAEALARARQLAGDSKLTSGHIKEALKAISQEDQDSEHMEESDPVEESSNRIHTERVRTTVTPEMIAEVCDEIRELVDGHDVANHVLSALGKLEAMLSLFLKQTVPSHLQKGGTI